MNYMSLQGTIATYLQDGYWSDGENSSLRGEAPGRVLYKVFYRKAPPQGSTSLTLL